MKVFKSLLLLSLLETVLWSLCLVSSASGAPAAVAQAYYVRETVNLKSTPPPTLEQIRANLQVDAHSVLLALKEEGRSQKLLFQEQQYRQSAGAPVGDHPAVQFSFLPVTGLQEGGADSDEPAGALLL